MKRVYSIIAPVLLLLIGLGMVSWGAILLHMYLCAGTAPYLVASAIAFAVANLLLRMTK